ncbi:MAG: GNAT family N-acetyltransferase [Flavobacterium sp.]
MSETHFTNNQSENQFELHKDGQLAFLEYILQGEKLYLTHTEAPEALRGTGAAASLVKQVLGYAREHGLTVVPSCSYVAAIIMKSDEWNDILSDGYQM